MDVLPYTPHTYRDQLALTAQLNPQMHPAPYGPGKACMQVRPAAIVAAGRKSWASIVFVASCLTRIYGDGHRIDPVRVGIFHFLFFWEGALPTGQLLAVMSLHGAGPDLHK